MRGLLIALTLLATPAFAQVSVRTTDGSGAILRSLDRITGQVEDFEVRNGQSFQRGKMTVTVRECRYPRRAIDRDAFAFLMITSAGAEAAAFDGWMVASSPALSALEHPRYDVWVLRCLAPT